jgi:propanol-preferring alcohol dehydrogenase
MKAMVLRRSVQLDEAVRPLELADVPIPSAGEHEILVRVNACGVCHTELDQVEGRLPQRKLPVIPGHQVAGVVEEIGGRAGMHAIGDRVGVAWIHSACGSCDFCRTGRENLCAAFRATGRDVDGGYAERLVVPGAYAYRLPETHTDAEAAPLLCAGAIGYRSLALTGLRDGEALGLTGFGASGHLVLMLARNLYPASDVFVFARSQDEQAFALELGAVWAGDTAHKAPRRLRAIIDTTPAWKPVVEALANLEPGGRLVINAIRKEEADKPDLLRVDYSTHLWMEKEIKTVANVCPADVEGLLSVAAAVLLKPKIVEYPLEAANQALLDLKRGGIPGAKVLRVG